MTTEIKKKNDSDNLPAGLDAAAFGGSILTGLEDSTPQLSRVVLYQGTAEEEEMYGEHKRGQFLDALESRELGDKIKIMPVAVWETWAKFEPGSKAPVYSTNNKAEVPAADLEWQGTTPPAATYSINAVVVVVGEAWPYLITFKRTGLKAFSKCIKPIEARREMQNLTPGLYELASVDDKSGDGKPFKRLTANSLGNPDAETATLAKTVYDALDRVRDQAQKMADGQNPFDGDNNDPPF